jgi:hypothetical protein
MDNEGQTKDTPKKVIDLRLQFLHKPIRKRIFGRKYPFLIQNEPFEYGLRITNIGSEHFSGGLIEEFIIQIRSANMQHQASKFVNVKPLNPGEECSLYFDKYTLWHEGSISTSCKIKPQSEAEEIRTFQHHRDHNIDEPSNNKNEWWHDYYCQSQQQLLQTRTNNLILLLTTITVLEAIFGLTKILKASASILAYFFSGLVQLFSWIAS